LELGVVLQFSGAAIRKETVMREHLVASLILMLTLACAVLGADNSQRDKMKNCNEIADQKQLTGEERKNFISSCLKGDERTKPSEMSQKEKRKKCDEIADKKSLKGDDRKAFMATCLSTSAATR
jgi:psiF repeat